MFEVADLADGGITILKNQPDFARGEFNMGILSFLCHQLAGSSCAPDNLTSLSHFQLDIVNQCACWDISQGQGIAGLNICGRACDHLLTHMKLRRGEDIPLFAIIIV